MSIHCVTGKINLDFLESAGSYSSILWSASAVAHLCAYVSSLVWIRTPFVLLPLAYTRWGFRNAAAEPPWKTRGKPWYYFGFRLSRALVTGKFILLPRSHARVHTKGIWTRRPNEDSRKVYAACQLQVSAGAFDECTGVKKVRALRGIWPVS